jgi:beta-glucuronidase
MGYFHSSTAMLICACVLILNVWVHVVVADGILYPQDSETRQVENLNGLWNFRAADTTNQEQGFTQQWFNKPLDQVIFFFDSSLTIYSISGVRQTGSVDVMPVPSSFNDIDQNAALRDHTGWVWYDRTFFVPKNWQTASFNVKLRFGSAHYVAVVVSI